MVKVTQKVFSLYSLSKLIDWWRVRLKRTWDYLLWPHLGSLVINFPFTSGWGPVTWVWQKHNLWFLLKQVLCRDRQAWFKDIKKWRLSPFSGHLFQYSVTLMVRNMCLILNLNLSRFNFQPLVLGMLFFTRLSSPSLATVFCLSEFLNAVIKLQCKLLFATLNIISLNYLL